MKLRLFIGLVFVAALLLAVVGWTLDGFRWLVGGRAAKRADLAPA